MARVSPRAKRSIGASAKIKCELELGDGAAEHREIDRATRGDGGKRCAEKRAVFGRCHSAAQHRLADRLVAETAGVGRQGPATLCRHRTDRIQCPIVPAVPVKPGDFNQFSGRQVTLGGQQVS